MFPHRPGSRLSLGKPGSEAAAAAELGTREVSHLKPFCLFVFVLFFK